MSRLAQEAEEALSGALAARFPYLPPERAAEVARWLSESGWV